MIRPKTLAAAAALLTSLFCAPAYAGDFIDSRITFIFSDDNIFAGPEDFSPQPDFTQRPGVNDVNLPY